ncbi:MAG TPA: hypothetical protein VK787_07475 [Puia sp.]|jgi:hypothetical protein|nr:hypothetical protein [Puia sp.]
MNTYEAAAFIEQKLPEAQIFEKSGRLTFDIYKTISCLTEFMRKKFLDKDMATVQKSLNVAETIYTKGDNVVKSAIENIFVFSFSGIMPGEKWKRNQFKSIIPITLFTLYIHQITHSYC